jgi:hypothetical protein
VNFANDVLTGKPKSYQVQTGVVIGLVAAAFWYGSK